MKLKVMLRNIRYFLPILFKVNPIIIVTIFISAIFNSLSSLIWVYFPKLIIEELMGEKNIDVLARIVIIFVLAVFILRVLSTASSNIQYYFTRKADFKIDEMFNEKITSIDYFHLEDPKFNDKLSYAKKCLEEYSNGIYSLTYSIREVIQNIITIAGVVGIILFSQEYWLIGVTIIGVVLNTIIYGRFQKIQEEYNVTNVRFSRRQWYFNNSIMNFRSQKNLRLYDARGLIDDISNNENRVVFSRRKKTSIKMMRLDTFNNIFSFFVIQLITIIILVYSIYYHNSTIAVFTMLYSAIQTLNDSTSGLIYSIKKYYQDCVYQDNFINLMEMETVFKDGTTPIDHIDSVEFKNVSFKYPRTEEYILKNISFKLSDKKKISLVGLNGSGKTTLVKLLCRFFEVKEGEILVNGININNYKYDEYIKQMAIIFQDYKIISFNIKSNVAIIDDNREKLYDTFQRAQVLDKVLSLPDKENTYINKWFDKSGIEFSGGEMQKFSLARGLYKDSDLIILDEPTSALDPIAESEIYYHFKDVVGEKLTLFISHRLSSCIFSDQILVIDGNEIVEKGSHKDLMKNKNGLYYKMFTKQAEYYKS
ncbi:MAG: ABC transporter ATP-binding protein [Bacilli bacterium]|nr:ABC transporter ATP-binding protein [Bacilli bacterium]